MPELRHDDGCPPIPVGLMEPTDSAERKRLLDEAEIAADRGAPHDEVAAWLFELAAGRPAKAPCDP